jgi:hypothetical protein
MGNTRGATVMLTIRVTAKELIEEFLSLSTQYKAADKLTRVALAKRVESIVEELKPHGVPWWALDAIRNNAAYQYSL